jgi:hypothetical protein
MVSLKKKEKKTAMQSSLADFVFTDAPLHIVLCAIIICGNAGTSLYHSDILPNAIIKTCVMV